MTLIIKFPLNKLRYFTNDFVKYQNNHDTFCVLIQKREQGKR